MTSGIVWKQPSEKSPHPPLSTSTCPKSRKSLSICSRVFDRNKTSTENSMKPKQRDTRQPRRRLHPHPRLPHPAPKVAVLTIDSPARYGRQNWKGSLEVHPPPGVNPSLQDLSQSSQYPLRGMNPCMPRPLPRSAKVTQSLDEPPLAGTRSDSQHSSNKMRRLFHVARQWIQVCFQLMLDTPVLRDRPQLVPVIPHPSINSHLLWATINSHLALHYRRRV